ncbi:unnamed protein product, partial [Dibothriocephalus latus]
LVYAFFVAVLLLLLLLLLLIIIINSSIFSNRNELLAQLRGLPNPMQTTDVAALVELTLVYARNTPSSFFNNYLPLVFGSPPDLNNEDRRLLTDALSLLISVEEILDAQAMRFASDVDELSSAATSSGVRFLLVDCRPADQYNAGHLATAFYLDTELMLSNPPEFTTIVKALLQSQQRGIASGSKAAGEHIVFMGSGRAAEDRIANMVVAHFLRLGTPYISLQFSNVPLVAVNLEHSNPGEAVDFQACKQMPEVKKYFECRLLDATSQLSDNGLILLLERQFIVIQERRQVLADTIATLNHLRVPELITFHFSRTDDLLSDSLGFVRVYIHKAGDAVKAIKLAVFNVEGEGAL